MRGAGAGAVREARRLWATRPLNPAVSGHLIRLRQAAGVAAHSRPSSPRRLMMGKRLETQPTFAGFSGRLGVISLSAHRDMPERPVLAEPTHDASPKFDITLGWPRQTLRAVRTSALSRPGFAAARRRSPTAAAVCNARGARSRTP